MTWVLRWVGYIIAMAIMIAIWNHNWPQYTDMAPDDWRWWLRAVVCASVITCVVGSWKEYRNKQRGHNVR